MNRIIIALVFLGIAGWAINRPDDMPSSQLDSYDNAKLVQKSVTVGGPCWSEKCLLVYVAPWCSSCTALTPTINDLVKELERDGVATSIIVGSDSKRNVLDYSKKYRGSVFEDARGDYFDMVGAKGVPYFAVTNRSGKRIATMTGGYTSVREMRKGLDL